MNIFRRVATVALVLVAFSISSCCDFMPSGGSFLSLFAANEAEAHPQKVGKPDKLVKQPDKAKKASKPKKRNAKKTALAEAIIGKSTLKHASSANRALNMKLACEAINNKVLKSGEVFSFNDTVGQRTPERGYAQAKVIVGRQYVKGYGGGICQVSSALYNAILENTNFEIVERYKHTLPSAYTKNDAAVSYGCKDFKFKNLYKVPIRIQAIAKGGIVTVKLVKCTNLQASAK